ncbi:MAG: potassium-transporting ATPase subunit C [Actinomycetota bacterium]|jgi:K+-transporting ATPase ATPase C chain|nr:potassium-transporting ATPase subunit C [Actinomycetota bacterium]
MLILLRRSVVFAVVMMAGTLVYAFIGTGVAQLFFKNQANGSITANGSTLIGQNWKSPAFFHGRPDDAGPYAANAAKHISGGDNPLVANGVPGSSGATNLGPRSKVLLNNTRALVAYWHSMGVNPTPDLVTTSGSGYDPDISPADATAEIPMVAKATGIAPGTLATLIKKETHGPQFGFLGASYIDVLQLNEALVALEHR